MRHNDLINQCQYGYWARDKILSGTELLTPDQLMAPALISYSSIAGLLTHMLNVEHVWQVRCQEGESPQQVKFPDALTSVAELRDAWQAEETLMLAYLMSLDESQLDEKIHYKGFSGRSFENRLWDILTQFIHHGTHHRAELTTKLTELGSSVGDIDFIIYLSRRYKSLSALQ